MAPPELQQLDHGFGPGGAAVPLDQPRPEQVVARRPASELAPLLQGLAAGQCSWFVRQNVQVVLEVEDLLVPAVAALVLGDPPTVMPDLEAGGPQLHLDDAAGFDRHGVGIRFHLDAAQAVHLREADLRQVESLRRQGQQVLSLDAQGRADGLLPAGHGALLIRLARRQELGVQLRQVTGLGHRHPVVAPEPSGLALPAAGQFAPANWPSACACVCAWPSPATA